MEAYISFEKLIDEAKKQRVNFGKGDPYNRLRYYTKMGWLPHMVRMKNSGLKTEASSFLVGKELPSSKIKGEENDVTGHYPKAALKRLILIENMKSKNLSNEEITQKIQSMSKWDAFYSLINTKNLKYKFVAYSLLALMLFIIATETGIIHLGKTNNYMRERILTNIKP